MVGAIGFEPTASWSRTRRASQAALRPDKSHKLFQVCENSRIAQQNNTYQTTLRLPFRLPFGSMLKMRASMIHHKKNGRRDRSLRRTLFLYT
jgi:hypothetical protein